MKASLSLKLGTNVLRIEGEGKAQDIVENMAFWSQLPSVCSCGSNNIGLQHRAAKSKEGKLCNYYGLKCNECGAELTFHEKQADRSFYITYKDKFERYNTGAPVNQVTLDVPPVNDDDIGF